MFSESLKKTDSSSDEDDDYTEIIEDDPEELKDSSKSKLNQFTVVKTGSFYSDLV